MTDDNSSPPPETAPQQTLWDRAWDPCDIASVALFRVVFGLTVLGHIAVVFSRNGIEYFFAGPEYHLPFFGFEWISALDADGMRRIHYLMAMAAVGVTLGFLYRVSAAVLFVTFTYTFLSEAAQYQNHYYLMSLVAFLMILIPAHRWFSVDAVLFPDRASPVIPNWCRWILMFQIGIPYFFGGIAKIEWDWMHAMPALYWFPENSTGLPLVGPLLAYPAAAWFISWFGLVFDLVVVPLLLWKPTRIWVYAGAVVFHVSNSILFRIDVFPWMMIGATLIFFPPDWPRRLLRLSSPSAEATSGTSSSSHSFRQRFTAGFLVIYIMWQILFPFRHWLYPGNPSWTEEGQLFAWRMMLRHKRSFFVLFATDAASGRMVEVPLPRLVAPKQMYEISVSPYQMAACAPFLAEWARRDLGFQEVEIRAFVLCSLNGRKAQFQVDPDLNLLTVDRGIWPQAGITPLTEPLPAERWDVPVPRWLEELDISLPVSVPVSD